MANPEGDKPEIDQIYDPEAGLSEYQSTTPDPKITPDEPITRQEPAENTPSLGVMQPAVRRLFIEVRDAQDAVDRLYDEILTARARGDHISVIALENRLRGLEQEHKRVKQAFEDARRYNPDETP